MSRALFFQQRVCRPNLLLCRKNLTLKQRRALSCSQAVHATTCPGCMRPAEQYKSGSQAADTLLQESSEQLGGSRHQGTG